MSSSGRELLAGVHVDPGDAEAIDELMRLADEARESALAAGAIDDGDSLFTRRSRRLATPQRRFLTTCATEIDIRVGTTKLRAGTTSGRAARGGPYRLYAGAEVVTPAASIRRCSIDTSVRRSSASSRPIGQVTAGAWAVVFRNMENVPLESIMKPAGRFVPWGSATS